MTSACYAAARRRRSGVARGVFAACVVVLAACGGGGGGSGGGSGPDNPTPTPPPPSGPDPAEPLAVTGDNALALATLAVAVPESLLQLVLSPLNRGIRMAAEDADESQDTCFPGSAAAALLDRDGDGDLSAGDGVAVDFTDDCFDGALNGNVTGGLAIDFDSVVLEDNGDAALAGRVRITSTLVFPMAEADPDDPTSEDVELRVEGAFGMRALSRADSVLEIVEVAADTADRLRIHTVATRSGTSVDTIRDFSLRREMRPNEGDGERYLLQFAFVNESGLIGGRVDCGTVEPLSGRSHAQPDSGRVQCDGAGNTAVRLDAGQDQVGSTVSVSYDASGTGQFAEADIPPDRTGSWADYVDGAVYTLFVEDFDPGFQPAESPLAEGTRIEALVNDVVYEPASDRLFLSNAAGITVLDATSLAVVDSVPLASEPGPLALSDDGSTLWVGFTGVEEMQRLNTADLTVTPAVSLGTPPAEVYPAERFADALAVAPGNPDLVVVVTRAGELVAFDDGTELPASIDGSVENLNRIVFRDATALVAANIRTSGFEVYRASLDRATGLTLERTLPRMHGGFESELVLGSRHLFAGAWVVNEIDETVEAELPEAGSIAMQEVAVDAAAGRVYGVDLLRGGQVNVYREEPLALLAAYRIDAQSHASRRLNVTPHSLIVASDTELLRIPLGELAPTLPEQPCVRNDLTGTYVDHTLVQLECPFTDAVYDPDRNLIYATVPGDAGPAGHAVVVVDPLLQEVVEVIPVGTRADSLTLAPDGSRLYVVTPDANRLIAIDPAARTVAQSVPLGFRLINLNQEYEPWFPRAVAASSLNADDALVASFDGEVALYQSGVRAAAAASGGSIDSPRLFWRSDAALALGLGFSRHAVFDVDSGGVSEVSSGDRLLPGIQTEQRGNLVYASQGGIFDLDSLTGDTGCFEPDELPVSAGVAAPRGTDDVLYAVVTDYGVKVDICDPAAGTIVASREVAEFGSSLGALRALVSAGPGLVAVVRENGMQFFPAPLR